MSLTLTANPRTVRIGHLITYTATLTAADYLTVTLPPGTAFEGTGAKLKTKNSTAVLFGKHANGQAMFKLPPLDGPSQLTFQIRVLQPTAKTLCCTVATDRETATDAGVTVKNYFRSFIPKFWANRQPVKLLHPLANTDAIQLVPDATAINLPPDTTYQITIAFSVIGPKDKKGTTALFLDGSPINSSLQTYDFQKCQNYSVNKTLTIKTPPKGARLSFNNLGLTHLSISNFSLTISDQEQ